MGSSAKKKREKKQDFQKTKLKVGKTRPKNTNATDTNFSAKSIVLKQQSLNETSRDAFALFNHNLSLLSSRNDTQRRDALVCLTTAIAASPSNLPQAISVILNKAQPLILDGSSAIRQQFLKLLKALPEDKTGSLDQLLLYTRAGMTHLSTDIRLAALDVFDWMIEMHPEAVLNTAGGWIKMLRTFQNLLSWHDQPNPHHSDVNGQWSASKPATNLGSNKVLVHQLTSLGRFLSAGFARPQLDVDAPARFAAALFPVWQMDAHMLSKRGNPFGHLNLFGAPRDIESEVYEDVEERVNIFIELALPTVFANGVREAKKEGGEVGRAAALVDKALQLVHLG